MKHSLIFTGLQRGGSLLYGVLDRERAQQDYSSDASLNFCPYVTDHLADEMATERTLRGRYEMKFIRSNAFVHIVYELS